MNMVNGYILYRLMVDKDPKAQPRRHSLMPTLESGQLSSGRLNSEPFCSPIAPHVPIRQRLSCTGRCGSAELNQDFDQFALSASNPYLSGRRRRMSLLQTLRQQNKQLADSGFELHQAGASGRETASPNCTQHRKSDSPPASPVLDFRSAKGTASSFSKLKMKTKGLFRKKNDRKQQASECGCSSKGDPGETERTAYSCIDISAKESRQQKSPSTNDSGHGSPTRLCIDEERISEINEIRSASENGKTVVIIERHPNQKQSEQEKCGSLLRNQRSLSCPQLGINLRIYHEMSRRTISMRYHDKDNENPDWESDDEEDQELVIASHNFRQQSDEAHTSPAAISEKSEEAEPILEEEEIKFAERMMRNSSPLTIADCILEKRIHRRALAMHQFQQMQLQNKPQLKNGRVGGDSTVPPPPPPPIAPILSFPSPVAESPEVVEIPESDEMNNNEEMSLLLERVAMRDGDAESTSTRASEEIDEDDSASTILLDQYLPILTELYPRSRHRSRRSSSLSSAINGSEEEEKSEKVGSVTQTDLSLLRISDQLSTYLNGIELANVSAQRPDHTEGMNFLAKHFFEYQSFLNLPHKAVQLHKPPPTQAGTDQSAGWAPKSMTKAGKNQAAPGARANRNNADTRQTAHRHGRAGKHEFREWGERHGELKAEKAAPHKDAWTKFLMNEEAGKRNPFESEFEDRILQVEPETLPERLQRTESNSKTDFSLPYALATNSGNHCETEVLTILTYAPQVQFVTATVKKAKCLPFNNRPFARVMLFEGRRLLEQKQTTITPATLCNGCVGSCSRQKPAYSNSSTSSSSVSSVTVSSKSNDTIFSESFLFHVSPQMLDRCHIVIEMYDSNPGDAEHGSSSIGHCVVGPMCSGTGCAHWLQMIRKSGLPVCMWHRLTKS